MLRSCTNEEAKAEQSFTCLFTGRWRIFTDIHLRKIWLSAVYIKYVSILLDEQVYANFCDRRLTQ